MKTLAAVVSLIVLDHAALQAQESTRNAPPRAVRQAQQPQQSQPLPAAPVGHRQPRQGDLPPENAGNDPASSDAQDRELDRMIKGICRGC